MPRLTAKFLLPNLDRECEIIAAADPVFGKVTPDAYTAYARVKFAKSLPMVAGPESVSGAIFGLHPAVIARSFQTILHKQMNMGHTLKAMGSLQDRICGCVLQCAFPEGPEGGWVAVPATVEEAPSITALGALFKQAAGVPKMLGDHLGNKVRMSVSMEFTYYHDEVGIYDPSNNATYDRKDIPRNLASQVHEDEHGRLSIRKGSRLVLAVGGVSGRIWFSGVGYTDRPAESSAEIESIAASRHEEGLMVCGGLLADLPQFAPGMAVVWKGGEFNRGRVTSVHREGSYSLHGKTLAATPEDPALFIRLPDGSRALRRASSVLQKS